MKIKAAVLHAMNAKPPFAESRPLSIEEIDLAPPGPGEILVKIGAAGLCHSDLSVINGHRPRPMPHRAMRFSISTRLPSSRGQLRAPFG